MTGKRLSENESASLILIADNSKAYSYVPDGMTNAEENRLIAVSGQYYQAYLPLDAFTGKLLSTTERMSITYDVESAFYNYLPDGKNDTQENRLITIGYGDYKRFYLVNSVTGEALTDSERASLITSDNNTHLYLPDEKEDLPTNRCIALSKQAYDSQLNKKIFGKNGYKIQKLTNTHAVLIVFCDEQWEVASRHFTAVFMRTINAKCRIAKRMQKTHEKPDFQLVIVDNSTLLVLHNPIFVLNLKINFPPEEEWLPAKEVGDSEIVVEDRVEPIINPQEFDSNDRLEIFDEPVMDNLINPAESTYGFFSNTTAEKGARIHERSWISDEELPTKRRRTSDCLNENDFSSLC